MQVLGSLLPGEGGTQSMPSGQETCPKEGGAKPRVLYWM